jgi:hypothetical protein
VPFDRKKLDHPVTDDQRGSQGKCSKGRHTYTSRSGDLHPGARGRKKGNAPGGQVSRRGGIETRKVE